MKTSKSATDPSKAKVYENELADTKLVLDNLLASKKNELELKRVSTKFRDESELEFHKRYFTVLY